MLEIDFLFLFFLQQPSPLLDYSLHVWMLMRMRVVEMKVSFLWGILAYITKIFFFLGYIDRLSWYVFLQQIWCGALHVALIQFTDFYRKLANRKSCWAISSSIFFYYFLGINSLILWMVEIAIDIFIIFTQLSNASNNAVLAMLFDIYNGTQLR